MKKYLLLFLLVACHICYGEGSTSFPFSNNGGGSTSFVLPASSGGGGSTNIQSGVSFLSVTNNGTTAFIINNAATPIVPGPFDTTNAITSGTKTVTAYTTGATNVFKPTISGATTYAPGVVFYSALLGMNTNVTGDTFPTIRVIFDDFGRSGSGAQLSLGNFASGGCRALMTHDQDGTVNTFGGAGTGTYTTRMIGGGQAINIQPTAGSTILANTATGVGVGVSGTEITKIVATSVTYDAPSIVSLTAFSTNIALTGCSTGARVEIGLPVAPTSGIIYQGFCPSNGFATILMHNYTAAPVDPANQTIGVTAINH